MERIHGNTRIKRRTEVNQETDYHKYKDSLREDFGRICGYCGKSEIVTKNTFEIDHFVPQRLAPERECDYSNLVYSCFICNRKKSGKWPSENKEVSVIDGKGFIDPASDEYDKNLQRDENGNIIGITEAGKYMAEEGLCFNSRPMREVYKASIIFGKMEKLKRKIEQSGDSQAKLLMDLFDDLLSINNILFEKRE